MGGPFRQPRRGTDGVAVGQAKQMPALLVVPRSSDALQSLMRRLLQQKFLAPRNENLETVSAFTSSEDVPSSIDFGHVP